MNVTLKYNLSNDLNHKYFRQVFTDGVNKWDVGSFFFHTFFFQPDELHPAFSFSFFFYKNKCNNNAGLRHALAFRLTKLFKNSNSSSSFFSSSSISLDPSSFLDSIRHSRWRSCRHDTQSHWGHIDPRQSRASECCLNGPAAPLLPCGSLCPLPTLGYSADHYTDPQHHSFQPRSKNTKGHQWKVSLDKWKCFEWLKQLNGWHVCVNLTRHADNNSKNINTKQQT